MTALEELLDAVVDLREPDPDDLVFDELRVPPRPVLVPTPALPAVQRRQDMLNRERRRLPGEVVDDVSTPHRDVRHVEDEDATGCEDPVHLRERLARFGVREVLDDAEGEHFVQGSGGQIELPRIADEIDPRERVLVVVEVPRGWTPATSELELAGLTFARDRAELGHDVAPFSIYVSLLLAASTPVAGERPQQAAKSPDGPRKPHERRRPYPVAVLDRDLEHAEAGCDGPQQQIDRERHAPGVPAELLDHRASIGAHPTVNVTYSSTRSDRRDHVERPVGEVVRSRHRRRSSESQSIGPDDVEAAAHQLDHGGQQLGRVRVVGVDGRHDGPVAGLQASDQGTRRTIAGLTDHPGTVRDRDLRRPIGRAVDDDHVRLGHGPSDVVDHSADRSLLVAGDHHDRGVGIPGDPTGPRRIRIGHRTDCATVSLSSWSGTATSVIAVGRRFSRSASSIERITQPSTFRYSKAPKRPCGWMPWPSSHRRTRTKRSSYPRS